MRLTHGSLFSGIGGFDLAAEWAGFQNIFSVEIDDFCDKVLKKNFPEVKRYYDIRKFDGTKYRGTIDVLSGGFPCQPFSVAGKRRGNQDDRYLWKTMFKTIHDVKPTWIIGENVPGIISMELDTVLFDLESEDYTCQTFIIPACGKGAWHRRNRVWIIAYNEKKFNRKHNPGKSKRQIQQSGIGAIKKDVPNTDHERLKKQCQQKPDEPKQSGIELCSQNAPDSNKFNDDDRRFQSGKISQQQASGIQKSKPLRHEWWATEPGVGRMAHGLPDRVDRLKALGNAIVPQVAYEFFRIINEIETKCI